LWESLASFATVGLAIIGLVTPLLIAHQFAEERASASATRWGLAGGFLFVSALLWARNQLGDWCDGLGIRWRTPLQIARIVRGLFIFGAVFPVLALTLTVAWLGFAGESPAGPLPGSFFHDVGWVPSMVIPLVVVAISLTGHGVRENSAGYIFSAGLVIL